MNGKQTSWLLRALSLTLAALMVFGNVILPGGVFKASAEETTTLFTTDFEDYTVGQSPYLKNGSWYVMEGGTNVDEAESVDQVTVVENNGNKFLAVSTTKGTANLTAGYALGQRLSDVTLSYNIAIETKGNMYYPTFSEYANYDYITKMGLSGTGNWVMHETPDEISENDGYARDASGGGFGVETLTWYTVKVHYSTDGTTGTAQVWVNGTLTDIGTWRATSNTVNSICMTALNTGSGKMYVDNIKVTVGDHEPAAKPADFLTNKVLYQTGFETTDAEKFAVGSFDFGTAASSPKYGNWSINSGNFNADYCDVEIKSFNGNQVLSVNNNCGTGNQYASTIQLRYNGTGVQNEIWMSYNFALSTKATTGFFMAPGEYGGFGSYAGVNGGAWKYEDPASGATNWIDLTAEDGTAFAAFEPLKWYTVMMHYAVGAEGDADNNASTATFELWIDGVKTNAPAYNNLGAVRHLMLELSKFGVGETEMFIDNIQVSTQRHTPAEKPASLIEEEKKAEIYYTENFDDETVGEDVSGLDPAWFTTDFMDQYKVAADPAGKSGNVLQTVKTATSGPRAEARPWKDYTLGKAVLEYKLYYTGSDQGMYPLSFFSSQQNALLAMLVLQPGGVLQYQNSSGTNINLTTLSADTWHDIKLIVDVAASRWYIYVDGEIVGNISGFKGTIINQPYIRGIELNAWGKHNATGIYYDDIVVSEYMPVTGMSVAESELTMRVGGVRQLNVTFEGSNASAPVATYTVDEAGSGVVSVDMFGKVTALANGKATITVSHPDLPDGSKTVTVTVETETITDPEVYYNENFDSMTVGEVGGAWYGDTGSYTYAENPCNNNNKALMVNKTNTDGGKMVKVKPLTEAVKRAVLEYSVYYTDGAAAMYALTPMASNTGDVIRLVLQGSGEFQYQVSGKNYTLAQLKKNEKNTIKLVVDTQAGAWYIWINGQYIVPSAGNATLQSDIVGLRINTVGSVASTGIYFDDIKLSQYVPVDSISVEETTLAMGTGETKQLTVSVAPANASLPIATFTSNNPSVAVVDGYGKITAVREGTAIITVASAQGDVEPATVTVNVTGEYVPVFLLNVDFENGNDGNYNVSGSAKAYGNVVDKNGNMVLEVNSNDPDAHGFVEIPLNGNYKKLTMSYHLGLSNTDGVFYIPTLSSCATIATKAGGNLEDTIDGNSWIQLVTADANKTGATYQALTWHTIKIMYDATGSEPTVRFFLDGVEYSVRDKNAGSVNKIFMQLTKWMGTQIAYIDNIRVSEEDHEPAAKPTQSLYVKAESIAFPEPTMTIDANVPTILTVNFTPAGASEKGVTFTSSDISIASFDAQGYLIGHKAGTVTITADPVEEGLENATLQLTVVVTDVTNVEIQSEDLTLPAGGNAFISAVVTPDNATFGDPAYSSSDTSIAVIDSFGQIVALKAGTVTITAAAEADPSIFDTITLTVTEPEVIKTIYVAPNGTAVAAGTKDAPVNLEGALALIAANNDDMTGNIEVILAGGYYHLSETLEITDAHGGNNNYSVIWKAAEGETPVIGSAYTVSGTWTEDKETGIWSISVPEWLDSRQLYVDNVRATRARSESGLLRCGFLYDANGKNIGYVCSNVELADFAIVEDLELVFKEQWTQPRIGVASITDNGDGSINMILDQPGWSAVNNKGGTSAGSDGPVWLENALELLDDAGEWYLDTKNDKLYYMPRPWEDMAEVKVTLPTIDGELVTVVGTDLDANRVQNIHFEGITFADTTWMRPSTTNGHSDAQNNHIRQGGDFLPTAAVVVKQANAIWFTGCTFTRLGINGLQMIDGVQNSFIVGNHFYDISGGAINIGEPDTGASNAFAQGNAMMKNNDILNNYIHNIGVDFGSSAAISVGFAAEMDMNHNEIFDTPYSGWHIGYGWNNRFSNNNKNMLIEYNFVHDFMDQGIYDGGGIYVLGNTSGDGYNIARYNYFRKQMNAHGALYPDQGTTFFKFIENVIDLSEVDSWVNNTPPKWSHTNMKTLHVHFINNYSTTNYKTYSNEINFNTDDVVYGELIVDPEAKWEGTNAPAIMAAAGLESAYAYLRNGQAERIVLNAGEEDMIMEAGETFALSVGFTDGKDNTVSGGDVTVAYDSKDPAVATVSDSGVITAVSTGVTTIRVWVVSNDILDVKEITVYVDDRLAEVKLDGVLGNISMSKEAVGKAYTATLYTVLGRGLEPETVTFAIANTAVATVSADGYLLPVAVGTTTLTVTATLNGESVSNIYKVTITDGVAFEEDNAWEMFDKEFEPDWYHNGSSDWVLVDETSINMKLHGYVTFTGAKYADELLSFKLKVDTSTGGGSWTPAIVLRAQGTNSYVSAGVDGYILCMGKGGLELYRYVNNVRHVIYGDFDENHADVIAGKADISCKQGGKLTNTAWTFDANGVAEHDIKIGAISDGGDVRIVLYVDGEEVINYLDKAENGAFSDAGYIGFIGRSETWTITKKNTAVEADNAWEMFDKEFEPDWYHNGSSDWVLVDDTSIDMKLHGYVTFTGAQYADELLSFKLKVDTSTGGGGWTPAIVLRAQGTNSYVSAGVDGYILCMGKDGLELYRYVNNVRHVIYGDFDENHADVIAGKADISCKQGGKLTNTAWTFDANGVAEHDIKIGAISDGGDVRIVLYVDGKEVINYLDKAENGAFSNAGYIGFIGRSEKWTITKNTAITDVAPSAKVGDAEYATAQEALEAAKEGDTVQLLADAEFDSLILDKGVTLDLNGNDLTVDYLVAFEGDAIIDSVGGVGLLKCKNVRLAANNPAMPVWDEAAGGYRLFTMKSQQKYREQNENGFEFIAKPVLGSHANDIFLAQSETNGLTVKVRLNWTSASGKAVEQFFILDAADMATIYSDENKVIQLNVTGAGAYANKLYTTCYIESETGVIWAPNGRLYAGE